MLFSFCAAFVLYRIGQVPPANPYMCADDSCVLITGKRIIPLSQKIHQCMVQFGVFSGLKFNLAKCGLVIKGNLHVDDQPVWSHQW